MNLPRLWPGQEVGDPFLAMRREMENVFRAFNRKPSTARIGAGAPAISVAETNDAFEVTAELPGMDEKDINVSLDDNHLVVSGEKKAESPRRKELACRGAELRLILSIDALPFEPEEEPSKLISTKVCCISRSRSPRKS